MNQLFEWLSHLVSSWKFWIVVPPWDVGIRVRLGKRAIQLDAGPHFRIPFLDTIFLVNTRLRVVTPPPVTIRNGGTVDKCRTISCTLGYLVREPLVAMLRFEQPVIAIQSYAQTEIARLSTSEECLEAMRKHFDTYGISIEFLHFVEDVEVTTFRILQNSWGVIDGMYSGPQRVDALERY